MKKQTPKFIFRKDKFGKYGYVDANGEVVIPFEYDWISTLQHEGDTHFLVNKGTTFGVFDMEGNKVVEMIDAVDRSKLSEDLKQLFKDVREFSLSCEEVQVLLLTRLKKQRIHYNKTDIKSVEFIILDAIFYDFISKCYILNATQEILIDILADVFIGIRSPFQKQLKGQHLISDIMKRLMNLIHDDEWVINFFTDYINEIIPLYEIKKIIPSLSTIDWEQCIVHYLMEAVEEEVL